MIRTIDSSELYMESGLFIPGAKVGGLSFIAQDARDSSGAPPSVTSAAHEARVTLENLRLGLRSLGQDTHQLVSLLVLLTDYHAMDELLPVLEEFFPDPQGAYPAITFLGATSLEGGCSVRVDAVASDSLERTQVAVPGIPLSPGNRHHGVNVGNLFFLAGIDAGEEAGRKSDLLSDMAWQTTTVLDRMDAVVRNQGLALADVFRTFMFMSDLSVRPGYQSARRARFEGVFKPEEFPANSGIGVQTLGDRILLRSVAIATSGPGKAYISSDKVRLTPSMFSQAVRAGDWLFLAGQDSIGLDHQTIGIGDLEQQTDVTLMHIKDVVEAVGGSLNDIVKTTVYLIEGQDRAQFAAAYRRFFQAHSRNGWIPAGLTLGVKELATDCLVEIDSVAYLG